MSIVSCNVNTLLLSFLFFLFFFKKVFVCVAEVSNLLVVTKERAPAPQTPMQESQLSFHRILKEEIEQVHLIFMCVSHVTMDLL